MAFLGSDFNPSVPADTDEATLVASLIRDVKSRLKGFAAVLFNLETGTLNNGVITDLALSTTGVTPGTFSSLTVNSTGRITAATNGGFVGSSTSPNGSITSAISGNNIALDLALGTPFYSTAVLTSAAGATPIILVPDTAVPSGKKCFLQGFFATVSGGTAWATVTTVSIQDTNGTPTNFITIPVASLTANVFLGIWSGAAITVNASVSTQTGGTVQKGLQVKADVNGTGSNLVVTVFGWIK